MTLKINTSKKWALTMYLNANWDKEKIIIEIRLINLETKTEMMAEFLPTELNKAKAYYDELAKLVVEKDTAACLEYGKGFHDGYATGKYNAELEAKRAYDDDDMWI